MKLRIVISTVALAGVALLITTPPLAAQSCQDEQGMAAGSLQSVVDMVATVKKESEADFESKFHQKSARNKLTFAINALDDAVLCLDRASQASAGATADQAAAYRLTKEKDVALKNQLTQHRDALKAEQDPAKAKALISGFDLPATPAK